MKKFISSIYFLFSFLVIQAQNLRFDYASMYGLNIKEFKDSTKITYSSNHGSLYTCKDHLVNVVRCLLGGDYGRVKIKGISPKVYIELELREPSKVGLEELINDSNKARDKNAADSLSLVKFAINVLARKYNFTVKSVTDTEEVWCLRVIDANKLPRFTRSIYLEDRGSGGDSLDITRWRATGTGLYDICMSVQERAKVVIYDETNETGLFDFENPTIPFKTMENFEEINLFLERYYGLHFVKRKQLEKLKIIEFK